VINLTTAPEHGVIYGRAWPALRFWLEFAIGKPSPLVLLSGFAGDFGRC
jgi:hypothetical protein